MATNLTNAFKAASGVTWIDIYDPTKKIVNGKLEPIGADVPKTLKTITENDWINIGGFREGTFNITGDDQTVTELKYENGQSFRGVTKDGTYGIEGNLPNIAEEIISYVLCMDTVDTDAWTGDFADAIILGYGNKVANINNLVVRLRFESGEWDYCIFPSFSLSSKLNGVGTSEDVWDIAVKGSASKSLDPDLNGMIYTLVRKAEIIP